MNFVKGEPFTIPLEELPSNTKPLRMIWIKPGTFIMGSPMNEPGHSDTENQFRVTLRQGYWLGQHLVTQAQWEAVINSNPSFHQNNPDYPVENINWYEATSFCDALNKRLKLAIPIDYKFSLPTEAQWEYACRAGTQSVFYNGDDLNLLSEIAWYSKNSNGHPHPVGKKKPNEWGLYDMLGNVQEWCYDSTTQYPDQPVDDWFGDPIYPIRSVRGGAYGQSSQGAALRCAYRGYGDPNFKGQSLGFRLCLRPLHHDHADSGKKDLEGKPPIK